MPGAGAPASTPNERGTTKTLDTHAAHGADGQDLVVLGESGGGKSALLANRVHLWRQAHPEDSVFQHYLDASPMSAGHLALLRRLMVAIMRWCQDENAESASGAEEERLPVQAEEIVKALPEYLGRLDYHCRQKNVGAVIVLDALNQIEDGEQGRRLVWLPYRMSGDIRLIVSTLPGDTLDALEDRNWPTLTVEPLVPDERTRLIAGYLAQFSQGLSDQRAERIAKVTAAANPLYLKTLLNDLRATGAYDRLDQQIDDYLQAQDIPTRRANREKRLGWRGNGPIRPVWPGYNPQRDRSEPRATRGFAQRKRAWRLSRPLVLAERG